VAFWDELQRQVSALPRAEVQADFHCVTKFSLLDNQWEGIAAATVLELVPPAQRATVSGLTEMAAGICFTAMTFGGGYMIAAFGYRSLFLLGAVLTGLSALVFWRSFRNPAGGHASHT